MAYEPKWGSREELLGESNPNLSSPEPTSPITEKRKWGSREELFNLQDQNQQVQPSFTQDTGLGEDLWQSAKKGVSAIGASQAVGASLGERLLTGQTSFTRDYVDEKIKSMEQYKDDPAFANMLEDFHQKIKAGKGNDALMSLVKNVADNPRAVGKFLAEMAPSALLGIGAGAVIMGAGAPLAAAGAAGAGLMVLMQSLGENFSQAKKSGASEDAAFNYAVKRTGSEGLVNSIGGAFLGLSPFPSQGLSSFYQANLQGISGAAGAAAGATSVGEPIHYGELAAEYLGEGVAGVGEFGVYRGIKGIKSEERGETQKQTITSVDTKNILRKAIVDAAQKPTYEAPIEEQLPGARQAELPFGPQQLPLDFREPLGPEPQPAPPVGRGPEQYQLPFPPDEQGQLFPEIPPQVERRRGSPFYEGSRPFPVLPMKDATQFSRPFEKKPFQDIFKGQDTTQEVPALLRRQAPESYTTEGLADQDAMARGQYVGSTQDPRYKVMRDEEFKELKIPIETDNDISSLADIARRSGIKGTDAMSMAQLYQKGFDVRDLVSAQQGIEISPQSKEAFLNNIVQDTMQKLDTLLSIGQTKRRRYRPDTVDIVKDLLETSVRQVIPPEQRYAIKKMSPQQLANLGLNLAEQLQSGILTKFERDLLSNQGGQIGFFQPINSGQVTYHGRYNETYANVTLNPEKLQGMAGVYTGLTISHEVGHGVDVELGYTTVLETYGNEPKLVFLRKREGKVSTPFGALSALVGFDEVANELLYYKAGEYKNPEDIKTGLEFTLKKAREAGKTDLDFLGVTGNRAKQEIAHGLNYAVLVANNNYRADVKSRTDISEEAKELYAHMRERGEIFAVMNSLYKYFPNYIEALFPKTYSYFSDLHQLQNELMTTQDFTNKYSGEMKYVKERFNGDIGKFIESADARVFLSTDEKLNGEPRAIRDRPSEELARDGAKNEEVLSERGKEVLDIIRNYLRTAKDLDEFRRKIEYGILDANEAKGAMDMSEEVWNNKNNFLDNPTMTTPGTYSFSFESLEDINEDPQKVYNVGISTQYLAPSDVSFVGDYKGKEGRYIRWAISRIEEINGITTKVHRRLYELGEPYRNLRKKDRKSASKVMDAFIKSDQQGEELQKQGLIEDYFPVDSVLEGWGLNPQEIAVYRSLATMENVSWDYIEWAFRKLGKTAPPRKIGYFHRAWYGMFKALVTDKDGNTSQLSSYTKNGLERKINQFNKMNPGGKVTRRQINVDPNLGQVLADFMSASSGGKITNFKKAIMSMESGIISSEIREVLERTGIGGYVGEKGYQEASYTERRHILGSPDSYIESVAHFLNDVLIAKEVFEPFNLKTQKLQKYAPKTHEYINEYIFRNTNKGRKVFMDRIVQRIMTEFPIEKIGPYFTGWDPSLLTRGIASFNRYFSFMKLGFSVPFYLANWYQPVYGMYMELARVHADLGSRGEKQGNLMRSYSEASKALVDIKAIPDRKHVERWTGSAAKYKDAVLWAIDNGYIDIRQEDKVNPYRFQTTETMIDVVYKPATFIEKRGRMLSFISAYEYFRGIYGDNNVQAYSAAKRLMDNAMGNYTAGHSPALLSDFGLLSTLIRPFATIQHYMLGRTGQSVKAGFKRNTITPIFATALVSMVFAGITGMMGYRDLEALIRFLNRSFGTEIPTPTDWLLKAGVDDFWMFGAVSAFKPIPGMEHDYNLSTSLTYPGYSEARSSVADLPAAIFAKNLGVTLATLFGAAITGQAPNMEKLYYEGLRQALPSQVNRFVENIVQDTFGATPSASSFNERVYRRDPEERMMGVLTGAKSTEEERARGIYRGVRQAKQKASEIQSDVNQRVIETILGFPGATWFSKDGMDNLTKRMAQDWGINAKSVDEYIKNELKKSAGDTQINLLMEAQKAKHPARKLFLLKMYNEYYGNKKEE